MLSHEDNELLCRVGPGSPMGELMRQYWIPCLPSSEFPEPDGPVKRMMLLSENFVMFRDTNGDMGAVAEACPHRGASMYFGRNEECGLRCNYHGWKFDTDGVLIDIPTERSGSKAEEHFKEKVRIRSYPCHEVNHMIWVYMGPRESPPPFPTFEINTIPEEWCQRPAIMMEEANWLQNMEGDLDSVHLDHLHRRLYADAPAPPTGTRGFWNPTGELANLDVERSEYGAYYSSARPWENDQTWHRINQFIFPFHTMISVGDIINLRSFVPLDDHHAMLISHSGNPAGPMPDAMAYRDDDPFGEVGGYEERTNDPRSYFVTKANKSNDYYRDLDVEKTLMHCGIPFVLNLPDRAMTELMCSDNGEPLYDRTQENLGSTDAFVIAVRAQLLAAAKRLRDTGDWPPNVDDVSWDRVRAASVVLPADIDWRAHSKLARSADSGEGPSNDIPLIID
ncbi:MAG: phthalate 4,5-dioxygenase oxygenase subunit [Candidatus Poriferisodalaceae bacterium]|jgi:phthalate 4,5-dioxygenase oxygenase subunit